MTVAFSNNSTNATLYEWDFGDGTTSSEATPDHIYSQSGVYSVSLQAGDGVVTDTLTLTGYITVSEPAAPLPQADFAASPLSGTAPLSVTFTNSSTNASQYLWDFGDGGSQLTINNEQLTTTHVYTAGGVYTITLQAGDTLSGTGGVVTGTLTRTAYLTVTGVVTPVAAFSAEPLSGTAPLTVTFSNNSVNAGQYLWDFGDGATSTEANPGHTYSQSGLYTVTLQAGVTLPGSGEVVTATLRQAGYIEVVAPDTPQLDFSASPVNGTIPLTVTFTNSSTNASRYEWDFGDGTPAVVTTPPALTITHVYTTAGRYTVTLTAGETTAETGEVVSQTLSRAAYITATEPVTADFSTFPRQGTLPLLVQFLNTSGGATDYVWDFGDGTTSAEASPSHSYVQSGVYTISLQAGSFLSGTASLVTDILTQTGYITVTEPVLPPVPEAHFSLFVKS